MSAQSTQQFWKVVSHLANPAMTVICGAFLHFSQKNNQANTDARMMELKDHIKETKTELSTRIEEAKADLGKGINQTQVMALGAPLVFMNDPKKLPVMQERLKVFGACIRGGGGEDCIKGKGQINSTRF
ncbi:hypothetical protein HOY82DRAFT_542947 [Tuber indicum]|nr:hypothetical protein HOY82DRAFT_542947 [Tuber indicum]